MIKIRINPAALDEFQYSEHGSWEDNDCPTNGHVYNILTRHKGIIEVRDDAEAAEVYVSACSSTFGLNEPESGKTYFKTACRIADELRAAALRHDPKIVARYPRPDGY